MIRVAKSLSSKDKSGMLSAMHERTSSAVSLNRWGGKVSAYARCRAKIRIDNLQTVQGKYFDPGKGSNQPYTQQVKTTAENSFDCAQTAGLPNDIVEAVEITADPQTGYYIVSFPAFAIAAKRAITNNLGGGMRTKTVEMDFPAFKLKGLKLPATGEPIHGKRRIENVGTMPDAPRSVRMSDDGKPENYHFQVIAPRPPVSLDAVVTRTFTPDDS